MEYNKRKLNVLTISENVCYVKFNIPPIMKLKKKMLKFNCGNMEKMRMTPYLDMDKCLLKFGMVRGEIKIYQNNFTWKCKRLCTSTRTH